MKPFWLMTITCLSVWSVLAILIFAWVKLRSSEEKKGAPSDREMLEEIRNMDLVQQIRLSTSTDPKLRLLAVTAMEGNRQERAIDALIARLQDDEAEVVATTLRNLGALDEARATDAFLDKLQTDDGISYHPGLLRRHLEYGSDRLVDWLVTRAKAGDEGAVAAIGAYTSPHSIGALISLLQGDAFYLWDKRRREAAELLARQYVTGSMEPDLKRRIEGVEGYVWMDSRGSAEELGEENGEGVRVPVGRSLQYFIEAQLSSEPAEAGTSNRP